MSHYLSLLYLCRLALSSMDMEQRDYDSRTALHVAAAEGKTHLYWAVAVRVASKFKPQTSVNCPSSSLLCITDISASSRTRGSRALPPGGLQSEPSTQRQVSPPLLGPISDLRIYSRTVFLVTDGATRRWTKRCTSATTVWLRSCSGVRRHAPPPRCWRLPAGWREEPGNVLLTGPLEDLEGCMSRHLKGLWTMTGEFIPSETPLSTHFIFVVLQEANCKIVCSFSQVHK